MARIGCYVSQVDNTQALRSEEVIQDKHTSTDNANMQHNMINEIRGILNLVKK